LWWDVRLDDIAAIAGLVQAVALRTIDAPLRRPTPPEALAWSAFMASRDGLDARVLERGGDRRTLREIAVRAAAEHGLDGVARIAREGNGATRQRAAHASGGMRTLVRHLAKETSAF
jgi:gamma-glutamyl:cysteine ligase YbdK (ATP-grasp superfamily)